MVNQPPTEGSQEPHFPSHDFETNAACLITVLIACDLTYWTQGLCLTGAMAKAEPKKLGAVAHRREDHHHRAPLNTASRRRLAVGHHLAKRLSTPRRPALHVQNQPTQPAAIPREPPSCLQRAANRCSWHPNDKSGPFLAQTASTIVLSDLPTTNTPDLNRSRPEIRQPTS
jgi:hypothetical protein